MQTKGINKKKNLLMSSKNNYKNSYDRPVKVESAEKMILDNRFKFSEDELKLGPAPASQLLKLQKEINKQTKRLIKKSNKTKVYNESELETKKMNLELLEFEKKAVYQAKIHELVEHDVAATKYKLTHEKEYKSASKAHKELYKVLSRTEKRVKLTLEKAEKDLRRYEMKLDKQTYKASRQLIK